MNTKPDWPHVILFELPVLCLLGAASGYPSFVLSIPWSVLSLLLPILILLVLAAYIRSQAADSHFVLCVVYSLAFWCGYLVGAAYIDVGAGDLKRAWVGIAGVLVTPFVLHRTINRARA
jgi:hypothetical protein